MVNYCIVPDCTTNRSNGLKLPVFLVPKDVVLREEWRRIIGVENLSETHRVCQKHFSKEDVITSTDFFDSSGKIITTIPLKYPRLSKNAKPCFVKVIKNENNVASGTNANDFIQHATINVQNKLTNIQNQEQIIDLDHPYADSLSNVTPLSDITNLHCNTLKSFEKVAGANNENNENFDTDSSDNKKSIEGVYSMPHHNENNKLKNNFVKLCGSLDKIILPENCYLNYSTDREYITLFEICVIDHNEKNTNTFIKRSINVNNNLEVHYFVSSKIIQPEIFNLKSKIENINELIFNFEKFLNINVCNGIADLKDVNLVKDNISYTDSLGILRHHRCKLLNFNEKCNVCSKVRKTISQKKLRMSKRNTAKRKTRASDFNNSNLLPIWKKKVRAQQNVINRAKQRIKTLKGEMDKIKSDIKNINLNDLLEKCIKNKIPDFQNTLIQEIISAAKSKHQKGHRYTESWVMLCLLLHIRSPKEYRHMRNINLLPLPCERTIRRYLYLTRRNCGFDEDFLKLFKQHLDTKNSLQEHGVLLLDEVSLRESVAVNSSTLTYEG